MDPKYCYKISWSLTRLIMKIAGQTYKSTLFSAVDYISLYDIVSLFGTVRLSEKSKAFSLHDSSNSIGLYWGLSSPVPTHWAPLQRKNTDKNMVTYARTLDMTMYSLSVSKYQRRSLFLHLLSSMLCDSLPFIHTWKISARQSLMHWESKYPTLYERLEVMEHKKNEWKDHL